MAGDAGKVRTSVAAKKKAKKVAEAPAKAEIEEVAKEAKAAMAEVVAEAEADDAAGVAKGEEASKDPKERKRKTKADRFAKAAAKADEPDRGVVYLGHIPKGFFEPQMRKFFSQFGQLRRLRLSRSAKNAASKGYAFIEFQEQSVAKIVAETMQNYLLFGKKLVCHVVAKDKQHPKLFARCNKVLTNRQPGRRRKARQIYNDRPLVEVDGVHLRQLTKKQVVKAKKRSNNLANKLKALDIEYSLDADEGKAGKKAAKGKAEDRSPAQKRKGEEAKGAAAKKKRKAA